MSSNSFLNRAGRSRFLKWSLALLLAFALLLALLPGLETTADAAYYDDAIQKLIGWDVLRGYPDGSLNPDSNITRAEFVALINRAYGYDELTPIPFIDVAGDAWYHDDISAAYAAGYFNGTTSTTASPSGELTREQAMVLLARNMRLDEGSGEVTSFSDGRAFQSYSAGYANTAVAKGLVSGYGDGSFRPGSSITRGEMAVMLSRALGNLVSEEGTYALGSVYGNVTINSPNVTLRNTTIAGDLYLTGGLGLGGVTLENVKVLGDIIVAGGGESNAGESVILRNVTADSVIVDTILGEYVSLRAEGDTKIGKALLVSDAYLQDRTAAGMGFQTIRMEGLGREYTLSGNLENIVNAAPYSMLRVSQAIAKNLNMDESATGASLWLDTNATVQNLTLDTATAVTGRGDVRNLNVNVGGTSTEMLPDKIEVRPGLTGSVAGETMDTTAAAEASSEPHIQAEYPKVINVAATTATANFSTNKSGTVYWAITSVSDGSVNEEGLLSPAAQSRIVRSGNLPAASSNTVYSVNITGLTSGGNYYLTAMLVDARGDYSPIKVVSFSTTDNSTPAFGSGYPYMSEINDIDAWATVMSTKTCQLYYVVFDKGSSAPTAARFRSGAFTDAYGYGVMDVQRNMTASFKVNNLKNLEELKSYDVYFWLNDADSAKSSAVKKLTFTTVDRTPPWFVTEPDLAATPATTSLSMTTTVNEAGTVYWVIVDSGEDYPKQPTTSIKDEEPGAKKEADYQEYFKLQIANGMNGIKSGSVKVRANIDAKFTISGLQAETQYKLYYIAMDAAGNYSEVETVYWSSADPPQNGYNLNSNYRFVSTLDERAPRVDQEFTRYRGNVTTLPYADTDVRLVFSERVQYYEPPKQIPLDEAYNDYLTVINDAKSTADQKTAAAETYSEILRKTIHLYSASNKLVNERSNENPHANDDDWVIDYRNAVVTMEGRNMVVIFRTNTEDPGQSALNLNSDATYHFEFEAIADTYDKPNQMGRYRLENFTTIAAQVDLEGVNLLTQNITLKKTDPGESARTVEVHTAFSMTPVSVSRADPTKSWDMLLWADKNVTFRLYRQEQAAGEDYTPDGWELVGPDLEAGADPVDPVGEIIVPGDNQYHGVSYWRDLKERTINPSVRDPGDGLSDESTYYYAIEILTIEGEKANVWSGNVNFWITVNTGDNDAFKFRWDNDLTEANYGIAIDPETTQHRLVEISVSTDGSEQFIRTISFTDRVAPKFTNGHPGLSVTDTSLSVSLLLERAGTVYWVVAPADGRITTNRLNYATPYKTVPDDKGDPQEKQITDEEGKGVFYPDGSTVNYGDYDVPIGGNAYFGDANRVEYKTDKDAAAALDLEYIHYLSAPIPSNVYNPRYTDPAIKTGSIAADGSSVTTLRVTGLTANTPYFLYIVTRGISAVYSPNVQLYQFQTEEAYRPKIEVLQSGTSAVNVRSNNMDAAVEYGLFQLDLMSSSSILYARFDSEDVMGEVNYAKYLADYNLDRATEQGSSPKGPLANMRVYEAMLSGPPSDGTYDSYFDRYADPTYKMQVYDIVTSSSSSGGVSGFYKGGTAGTPKNLQQNELTNPHMLYVDCDSEFSLEEGMSYYILTVSRYQYAQADDLSGNSYAFHAYSPIYKINTDKPKLVSISGDITVDYRKTQDNPNGPTNPIFTGFVTMTFDKDLYYRESENDRQPIHLYPDDETEGNTTYRRATDLASSSSGMQIKTYSATSDGQSEENRYRKKMTREIKLEMTAEEGNITFQNDKLASAYSQALSQMYLRVNLGASDSGNASSRPVTDYEFVYYGTDNIWQSGTENIRITVTVRSDAPTVQSISLDKSSIRLDGGSSADNTLTATVRYNVSNSNIEEVKWTVENDSIASVSPTSTYYSGGANITHGGHTVTITPHAAGTTIITASCGDASVTCSVTVSSYASFSDGSIEIELGKTADLSTMLSHNFPAEEIQSISWRSDDTGVATVGAFTGFVNTVTQGTAVITATITPRSGTPVSAQITVRVIPKST